MSHENVISGGGMFRPVSWLIEKQTRVVSGWTALSLLVMAIIVEIGALILTVYITDTQHVSGSIIAPIIIGLVLAIIYTSFLFAGLFTLEPNRAGVLILFGEYRGTIKESGFWWSNPLLKKVKISLRARNFNSDTLKVNDKKGNPIEIAVVVVWRVVDTAEAVFDVDDFTEYVSIQSESAVRNLASGYSYDETEGETMSLRSSRDEVSHTLQKELQERAGKAGVEIDEARISHLAYAPEIAGAMLQRQQAEAIIEARLKIVDGAVGMVEMALKRMEADNVITLDEERKAQMVSNLMVVLCGDKAVQPVLNTGSIY